MAKRDNTKWVESMADFNSIWTEENIVETVTVGDLRFDLFKKGGHGEFTIFNTLENRGVGSSTRFVKFSDAKNLFDSETSK
tara:strand:+ start:304 stop:546 length:243 start_codon:yes stop_codon:yes gene_type:complete